MKALRYHHGTPAGLQFDEVARPEPAAGEVLVEIVATSVNPGDWDPARLATARCGQQLSPFVPGMDFSGIVRGLGPGVQDHAVGDRVFGAQPAHRSGAFAEFVAAPVSNVSPAPQSISLATAAAVPLAALTAWTLIKLAGLEAGQSVLIHGGSGGAGSFAVQFARHRGAHVVATGTGRDEDFLRSLGARAMQDPQVPAAAGAPRVHAVLDLLGDHDPEHWIPRIREGGVLAAATTLPAGGGPTAAVRQRKVRLAFADLATQRDLAALHAIRSLIDAGAIRIPVTKQLPLDWAEVALAKSRDGQIQGKVLLHV